VAPFFSGVVTSRILLVVKKMRSESNMKQTQTCKLVLLLVASQISIFAS